MRDGVGQAVMIVGVEGVREALELRKAIPAEVPLCPGLPALPALPAVPARALSCAWG